MSTNTPSGNIYGEGNYEASRRFNEAEHRFVEEGKVAEAAPATPPKSAEEEEALLHAEEEAKLHAKGEDPELVEAVRQDASHVPPSNTAGSSAESGS